MITLQSLLTVFKILMLIMVENIKQRKGFRRIKEVFD